MKRSGVIAQKLGMTTLFLESGRACPVTLFSFGECTVIAVKKYSSTGKNFSSLQIGNGVCKKPTKPMAGHFAKAGITAKKILCEFKVDENHILPVGTTFRPDYFDVGQKIDISGVSLGKGFAGGMKRHNFHGLRASHGVSVSHRSIGSTGNRKDPGRTFKGKKMPGHLGCDNVTIQNLEVMMVDCENNLLVVKGSVPGYEGGWVRIRDAIKKPSSHSAEQGVVIQHQNEG